MTVRAFFRAAKVESARSPYDTIQMKIFYPAQMSDGAEERNLGTLPANSQEAPFPVVIFFNGINCGIEAYQWLAVKLVQRGIVVLTFSWVAENIPGMVAISPGVDLAMLAPNAYGTGPTASALPVLLAELELLQSEGVLAGMLDLERVILGGHSAGGRVAIYSARAKNALFTRGDAERGRHGEGERGRLKEAHPPSLRTSASSLRSAIPCRFKYKNNLGLESLKRSLRTDLGLESLKRSLRTDLGLESLKRSLRTGLLHRYDFFSALVGQAIDRVQTIGSRSNSGNISGS
ncbi:MAG: hypothetical protein SXA11_13790, partial [Cyanobacteriota bacterium]|nr:hypothetical protein [Cyanobacteriota bacterium]